MRNKEEGLQHEIQPDIGKAICGGFSLTMTINAPGPAVRAGDRCRKHRAAPEPHRLTAPASRCCMCFGPRHHAGGIDGELRKSRGHCSVGYELESQRIAIRGNEAIVPTMSDQNRICKPASMFPWPTSGCGPVHRGRYAGVEGVDAIRNSFDQCFQKGGGGSHTI